MRDGFCHFGVGTTPEAWQVSPGFVTAKRYLFVRAAFGTRRSSRFLGVITHSKKDSINVRYYIYTIAKNVQDNYVGSKRDIRNKIDKDITLVLFLRQRVERLWVSFAN